MTDQDWNDCVEACAIAAAQQDRTGREWVRDSLWANILKRAGDEVRKLKRPEPTTQSRPTDRQTIDFLMMEMASALETLDGVPLQEYFEAFARQEPQAVCIHRVSERLRSALSVAGAIGEV